MSSDKKRKIYPLIDLPPEVRAVTFAKCSRSPKSFLEIAKELTEEKSSQFHEKWVVGYGHSSVAEHAVLSLALENVSILATKVVEDNRLASYTEKSTRYQIFDRDSFYSPKKIIDSSLADLYQDTLSHLFDTYLKLTPKIQEFVKKREPKTKDTPLKMYETICKAKACDIVRYILPTATLTNLGMTINARVLEHAIRKLLSHPLDEMNEIGQEVKKVSLEITPTLVKYADRNDYLVEAGKAVLKVANEFLEFDKVEDVDNVRLVAYDEDAEDRIICGLLYRFSKHPYKQIRKRVLEMSPQEKEKIVDEALKRMGEHDWPIREFEHTYYTFDILIDYGAFRDIQRHRICTQTNQDISCDLGYNMPDEISESGLKNDFVECMEKAHYTYKEVYKKFPKEAQYVVPLAYKKRVLITWNLRELFHFIKLRSSPKGHISYRRVAQKIYQLIKEKHPLLAKYILVDLS